MLYDNSVFEITENSNGNLIVTFNSDPPVLKLHQLEYYINIYDINGNLLTSEAKKLSNEFMLCPHNENDYKN